MNKAKKQPRDGKVKWKNSRFIFLTNFEESMEKQLNSSEIFSKDFRQSSNLKSSQTSPSSSPCSTTLIGQRNDEICIPSEEKVKDYAMRFLQGHWMFLGPGSGKKCYGESSHPPDGERHSAPNKWYNDSKKRVIPCSIASVL